MRCFLMRSAMGRVGGGMRWCGMGLASRRLSVGSAIAVGVHCTSAAVTSMIGGITAIAVIVSSSAADEAMAAPAVAVAPAGPWTHAQEDAVIEIARPVKANRRAGVRRVVVITVGTGRLNTNDHLHLRVGR